MGLLFFILIVVLIAQVGFWHALGAIVGAFVMIILLIIIAAALVVVGGLFIAERATRIRRY